MNGEHTHWVRYHSRIIDKPRTMNQPPAELLQLIYLDDGIIFQEIEIKKE